MTKTVYITLFYISVLVSYALTKKLQYSRTGNYEKTFWDGPDGECEAPRLNFYVADGCSSGWQKDTSKSRPPVRQVSENRSGCRYFLRTTLFSCPKSEIANNSIICWKSVTHYLIRPICLGIWLNWSDCDAYCGVGKKSRVKFVATNGKQYQQIDENRPCKIRTCGEWSEWSGEKLCRNENCTHVFQRHCVYNNSLAPIKFCSGRVTDGNATAEIVEMPCDQNECVTTTASSTTQRDTSTVSITTQDPTTYETTDIAASTEANSPLNTTQPTVRDTVPTSVSSPTNTENETFVLPSETSENVAHNIDIWKGLVIGVFAASCLYGFISFLLFYRRKLSKKRLKQKSVYYDHKKIKRESSIVQDHNLMDASHNPLLQDSPQLQTLPTTPVCTSLPLPNAPSNSEHCIKICNDETDPHLYSNIPAFEHVTSQMLPCNSIEFRESVADSEDYEPRPDMFEEDSDPFDLEETRDVLRTLRKPTAKFKRKASSLPGRNQNPIIRSKSARPTSKGSGVISSAFSWKRAALSNRMLHHRGSCHGHNKAVIGSMTSLNNDTPTSGYNSSIADESTDDEYGGRIPKKLSQERQSRLRTSAKFLRRKLSIAQPNKALPNSKAAEDVDCKATPPRPQIQLHGTARNEEVEVLFHDAKPFLTMRPNRNVGFSVLSRNDRFVIVEDEYSLPIDAVTPLRPPSPNKGYNVPIDALHKSSDPT